MHGFCAKSQLHPSNDGLTLAWKYVCELIFMDLADVLFTVSLWGELNMNSGVESHLSESQGIG